MNEKCQVFTPYSNVVDLLEKVNYNSNLYGKKVIENACGDGNILSVIVERYICDCINNGMDLNQIKTGIETDIYGAEIDEKHYLQCLAKLNSVASKYNIIDVQWNLLNVDILRTNLPVKFDYVIGNPPYIKYRDLDVETRGFLQNNYSACSQGKFDYCYAFIEASLNCLSDTGKLSYLVPNSIFKNVFAQNLRELMLESLTKIYDYTTIKLFDNALTASAIIIANKEIQSKTIEYHNINENKSHQIIKTDLSHKWLFNKQQLNKKNNRQIRFGDYFSASITIATLLNKVYVSSEVSEVDGHVTFNNFQIEREILREAASPRSLHYQKKEWIIFPYSYENNELVRYTDEYFEDSFPMTSHYLKNNLDILRKRKSDKSTRWFEYGRTQALAHLNQLKLLTSTVVTKKVKIYDLSKECIPYSGIYIVSKGGFPLSKAKKILQSESFLTYVQNIGINASGSSLRITAADINNYIFSERELL